MAVKKAKDLIVDLTAEESAKADAKVETASDAIAEELAEEPAKDVAQESAEEKPSDEKRGVKRKFVGLKKNAAEQPAAAKPAAKYGTFVKLSGTVDRVTTHAKSVVVTLATRETAIVSNYPTIFFFKDRMEEAKKLKAGQRIVIEGHLNIYDDESVDRFHSKMTIVGSTIKPDERRPGVREAGRDADGYEAIETPYIRDTNEFTFKGRVKAIEIGRGSEVWLTILSVNKIRVTSVKFRYIPRDVNAFLQEIHVQDYVTAYGSIQTVNVQTDDAPISNNDRAEVVEQAAGIKEAARPGYRTRTRRTQQFVLFDIFKRN